jgi:hypothetical protein
MYRQIRSVDNTFRMAAQIGETLLFKPYTFQYREVRQEWMRPPRLRKSPNQHLFTGFEEYQLDRMTKSLHSLKDPYEIGKKHALPDIDAQRNILNLTPLLMTQLDKSRQKGRRQIVDAKVSCIFKALERMRFP